VGSIHLVNTVRLDSVMRKYSGAATETLDAIRIEDEAGREKS
jgi:hypothetical protein